METEALLSFRKKFRLDLLTIQSNRHWILSVRPGQLTLGSMVVSSVNNNLNFTDLSLEAGSDLSSILAIAENAAKQIYGAVRINVVCLMMQDPLIHFHIIPRYDNPLVRYNVEWVDNYWPGPPVFHALTTSEDILKSVKTDIIDYLNG